MTPLVGKANETNKVEKMDQGKLEKLNPSHSSDLSATESMTIALGMIIIIIIIRRSIISARFYALSVAKLPVGQLKALRSL